MPCQGSKLDFSTYLGIPPNTQNTFPSHLPAHTAWICYISKKRDLPISLKTDATFFAPDDIEIWANLIGFLITNKSARRLFHRTLLERCLRKGEFLDQGRLMLGTVMAEGGYIKMFSFY